MAEEIREQTEQTEEIPNAPDGEAGREPADQPEAEATGEQEELPQEPSELDTLWNETLPELAGSRGELTPETREQLLITRLAAQPQSRPTTGDQAEGPSPTAEADAGAPPVAELPAIDAQAQQAAFAEALETGDGTALAKVFEEQRAYVEGLGRLVHGSLKDQDVAIGALGQEVRMPNEMREALPNVRGANEADLKAAMKLLTSGEVKSAEVALKVATFNRQSELAAADEPRASASEAATRKAKGLRASQLAGGSVRGSQPAREPIIVNQQQHAEAMRREEAEQQ